MRVCPKFKWTKGEIERLKEVFPGYLRKEILELFPHRTWHAIEIKAGRLGIKRPKTESKNPMWKGDNAVEISARQRAIRNIQVPKGFERHHIDGNVYNNLRENIKILTRRQHMKLDGRFNKRDAKGRFIGGN
jgi:hypothetical protein